MNQYPISEIECTCDSMPAAVGATVETGRRLTAVVIAAHEGHRRDRRGADDAPAGCADRRRPH
jgi:hypothetical protein